MKSKEVIEYFGSVTLVAEALNTRHGAVWNWGEYPPLIRQFELEKITNGELVADYKGPSDKTKKKNKDIMDKFMEKKDLIFKYYKMGVRGQILLKKVGINNDDKRITSAHLAHFIRKISAEEIAKLD